MFLLGEILFRLRMTGTISPRRLTCVAALALTAPLSTSISALALVTIATALLVLLALSEQFTTAARPAGFEPATSASGGQRSIH